MAEEAARRAALESEEEIDEVDALIKREEEEHSRAESERVENEKAEADNQKERKAREEKEAEKLEAIRE